MFHCPVCQTKTGNHDRFIVYVALWSSIDIWKKKYFEVFDRQLIIWRQIVLKSARPSSNFRRNTVTGGGSTSHHRRCYVSGGDACFFSFRVFFCFCLVISLLKLHNKRARHLMICSQCPNLLMHNTLIFFEQI